MRFLILKHNSVLELLHELHFLDFHTFNHLQALVDSVLQRVLPLLVLLCKLYLMSDLVFLFV